MKLVVKSLIGDGYTFTCDVVRPVEYESAEALLILLEEAAMAARAARVEQFSFAGHDDWNLGEFGYETVELGNKRRTTTGRVWQWKFGDIEIMTVDEWFTKYSKTGPNG